MLGTMWCLCDSALLLLARGMCTVTRKYLISDWVTIQLTCIHVAITLTTIILKPLILSKIVPRVDLV